MLLMKRLLSGLGSASQEPASANRIQSMTGLLPAALSFVPWAVARDIIRLGEKNRFPRLWTYRTPWDLRQGLPLPTPVEMVFTPLTPSNTSTGNVRAAN
jgi:hypothetical protein